MFFTAEDIAARLRGARSLRSVRRDLATWAKGGWPRVQRVARPQGGRQWAVVADDYERFVRNLPPPAGARAAA